MIKTPTRAAQKERFTLACSSQQGESGRQETEEVGDIATSEKKAQPPFSIQTIQDPNPGNSAPQWASTLINVLPTFITIIRIIPSRHTCPEVHLPPS